MMKEKVVSAFNSSLYLDYVNYRSRCNLLQNGNRLKWCALKWRLRISKEERVNSILALLALDSLNRPLFELNGGLRRLRAFHLLPSKSDSILRHTSPLAS